MLCKKIVISFLTTVVFSGLITSGASALPFNDDMISGQYLAGHIMRPKDPNSVPVGSLAERVGSFAEAQSLVNPTKADELSVASGKRLFESQCAVCHGFWSEEGKHTPAKLHPAMPSMDLTGERYRQMSDGFIYGTIHFGSMSTLMPAYGWKFSSQEHWDLVNYIRGVQAKVAR